MPTTTLLVEHLKNEPNLRRFCGFERLKDIPSQATLSRAFAEFAKLNLGDKVLKALVQKYVGDKVVMHVSRDSTAVHAQEKPAKKVKPQPKPPKKRGRFKKGEPSPPKELTCLRYGEGGRSERRHHRYPPRSQIGRQERGFQAAG